VRLSVQGQCHASKLDFHAEPITNISTICESRLEKVMIIAKKIQILSGIEVSFATLFLDQNVNRHQPREIVSLLC
jgi:Fe-S cluster assembly iron-binding protein IscA